MANKSVKKMVEKEKNQRASNPGVANREARKAERGETFVGFRSCRMDDAKVKARKRSNVKKETREMVREHD